MNNPSVFVRHLSAKRRLLAGVFCMLICLGATVLVVRPRAGRSKRSMMRPDKVNVYGICPECGKLIEDTLERFPDRRWVGRIWGDAERLSPEGRVIRGTEYIFECPACDAKITAYVNYFGKLTRSYPYREHMRVLFLDSEAARDALLQHYFAKTNPPSEPEEVTGLPMTNGINSEALVP